MTLTHQPGGPSAADRLIDVLLAWGIDTVFTCPGSTEAPFLDASVARPELRVVLTTHEAAAVTMADGLSRATGKPAVAYLHANVGLTNGLSSLYAAQLARSPVILLNGLKPTPIQGRRAFTSARRVRDFVHQYVKFDWQSLSADAVPEDVSRAIRVSCTEPTGPSWVGLSQDLLAAGCGYVPADVDRDVIGTGARPDAGKVSAAWGVLRQARRPLIVVGSDVARHGAVDHAVRLSEAITAPVMLEDTRDLERAGFPSDHPHFAGIYDPRSTVVAASDAIFFLGCRCFTEFEPPRQPDVPAGATVIHSHSDPAEVGYLLRADVPLVGDERSIVDCLLDESGGPAAAGQRAEHVRVAHDAWQAWRLRPDAAAVDGGDEFARVPAVMAAIGDWVTDDVTIVADAITSSDSLLRSMPHTSAEQLQLTSSGSLGWGMGAALGMALGRPERMVMAITGDGGFQFGVPALWTAAHYGIPAKFVVINNGSYAAVGAALTRFGGRALSTGSYPGVDVSGVDVAAVAEGFGVHARRVRAVSDIDKTLTWARGVHGPALVEVMTDPADFGPSSVPPTHTRTTEGR